MYPTETIPFQTKIDAVFRSPEMHASYLSDILSLCNTSKKRVIPYRCYSYYANYSAADLVVLRKLLPVFSRIRPLTQETWCFFLHLLLVLVQPREVTALVDPFFTRYLAQTKRFKSKSHFLNSRDPLTRVVLYRVTELFPPHIHLWLLEQGVRHIYAYPHHICFPLWVVTHFPEYTSQVITIVTAPTLLEHCSYELNNVLDYDYYTGERFLKYLDLIGICLEATKGTLIRNAYVRQRTDPRSVARLLCVYAKFPAILDEDALTLAEQQMSKNKYCLHDLLNLGINNV